MELEPTPVENSTNEETPSLPFPSSRWGRILYGLFVIVMPPLAFLATELLKPEWQNGQLDAYINLLLSPTASWLFFPLLTYSAICYLFLLDKPDQYSESFAFRAGIYAGTVLAFQYSLLTIFLFTESPFVYSVWLVPLVFPFVYRWLTGKWNAKMIHIVAGILVVGIYLVSALRMDTPLLPLALVLAGLTLVSPFWIFLMFLRTSLWLFKKGYDVKFSFPAGFGIAAWLAVYIAAWRYDILKMYELYAALPPQPSDCYIATAAARGHPRFVGSWMVHGNDGKSMQVNEQLQTLKFAELGLMAVNPRLHATLRKIYDMVGKFMANGIQHPVVADVAYLFLKPCEWCAVLVLEWIVPEVRSLSRKLYMND